MASLSIIWRTMGDNRVCPICAAIEGYTWTFETGANTGLPQEISHPVYGVVWNIYLGSEAHGKHNGTCRCHMEPHFDLSELIVKTQALYNALSAAVEGTEEPLKT
jgi:hypothetical protein